VNRAEHLTWCKQRALAYVDAGELQNAFSSMASDMSQHPETDNPSLHALGMTLMMAGHLNTQAEMRRWIEGFN